jgi:hypothetical protein
MTNRHLCLCFFGKAAAVRQTRLGKESKWQASLLLEVGLIPRCSPPQVSVTPEQLIGASYQRPKVPCIIDPIFKRVVGVCV